MTKSEKILIVSSLVLLMVIIVLVKFAKENKKRAEAQQNHINDLQNQHRESEEKNRTILAMLCDKMEQLNDRLNRSEVDEPSEITQIGFRYNTAVNA